MHLPAWEPIIYYSSNKSIIIHTNGYLMPVKCFMSLLVPQGSFSPPSLFLHVCLFPIYVDVSCSLSFILTVKYAHWQISVSVETEIQSEGKQTKHSQSTPFAELLPFYINIKSKLDNYERLLLWAFICFLNQKKVDISSKQSWFFHYNKSAGLIIIKHFHQLPIYQQNKGEVCNNQILQTIYSEY